MVNAYAEVLEIIDRVKEEAEIEFEDARQNNLPTLGPSVKFRTCAMLAMMIRDAGEAKGQGGAVCVRGAVHIVPAAVANELKRLKEVERACSNLGEAVVKAQDAVQSCIQTSS